MLSICKQRIYLQLAAAVCIMMMAAACGPAPQPSSPTAAPQARKLLGAAVPYRSLSLHEDERHALLTDAAVRRERAWQVVAALLKPVQLAGGGSVPTWATWYGADDVQRRVNRWKRRLKDASHSLADGAHG